MSALAELFKRCDAFAYERRTPEEVLTFVLTEIRSVMPRGQFDRIVTDVVREARRELASIERQIAELRQEQTFLDYQMVTQEDLL